MKMLPIPEEKEYTNSIWLVTYGNLESKGKIGITAKTVAEARQIAEDKGITSIISIVHLRDI